MVKNEKCIEVLKSIISCIDNGDYYSAKEISYLKLKELQKETNECE